MWWAGCVERFRPPTRRGVYCACRLRAVPAAAAGDSRAGRVAAADEGQRDLPQQPQQLHRDHIHCIHSPCYQERLLREERADDTSAAAHTGSFCDAGARQQPVSVQIKLMASAADTLIGGDSYMAHPDGTQDQFIGRLAMVRAADYSPTGGGSEVPNLKSNTSKKLVVVGAYIFPQARCRARGAEQHTDDSGAGGGCDSGGYVVQHVRGS